MNLTDRDRKIAMLLIPVVVIAAYWFLLLAPKREEATRLGDQLVKVEGERDAAKSLSSDAESTRADYAHDYATVVRLGKAIPTEVDLPSLLVQLDRAAKGTHIRFAKITVGPRAVAPAATPATPGAAADGAPPVAAGGAPATSGSGTAVETANEGAAAAEGTPAPADGAAATTPPGTGQAVSAAPALDSVPLTFSFTGSFFDLADFFHEMKRFVRLADGSVRVDGRLMKIDGFTFGSSDFPTSTADVTASVYLAPKTEGTTAGGTPTGPAGSVPVSEAPAPADGSAPAAAPAEEGLAQ